MNTPLPALPEAAPTLKRCTRCGLCKPRETAFHRNRGRRDGYASRCKLCTGEDREARRGQSAAPMPRPRMECDAVVLRELVKIWRPELSGMPVWHLDRWGEVLWGLVGDETQPQYREAYELMKGDMRDGK